MYIKIKNIKQFLLIAACVFFAGFNYFAYVKADSSISGSSKTCDKAIDSDCDGLTNAEEKLYGTDPNNPDTDGDGYSDGVEVKSGYDPLKPAPGDKIVKSATSSNNSTTISSVESSGASLTDSFAQDLKTFVASKGNTAISNTDVNNFVTENLASKTGAHITLDSLPDVDQSQIKILKQNYSALSEADRKIKLQQDATAYYTKIIYILISNAPKAMVTNSDFDAFRQDFFEHMATLASTNPDFAYFSDLGVRIDLALVQINEIEVPESMLPMHIKALRIIRGFLALRDMNSDVTDPIAKMALLSKIQDLTTLATDYLQTDIVNYFNNI